MGIKRDKYDATVSDLVREQADYQCQRCGKQGRNGEWRMDAAHIFGRRYQSVRYDLDNILCLCFTCHRVVDEDYHEQHLIAAKVLGDVRLDQLVQKKNRVQKWIKGEKDEMKAHYMAELGRIKALRRDGEVGHIPAVNWF